MHMRLSLSLTLLFTLVVLVAGRPMKQKSKKHAPPRSYKKTHGFVDPKQIINLGISLTPADRAGLEERTNAVSTPGNALYGKHLSTKEIKTFAAPKQDTVDAVNAWLQESGVNSTTTGGAFDDWLNFNITVEAANALLNATFEPFVHVDSGSTTLRTLAYSLPVDMSDHIRFVHPTTSFVKPLNFRPVMSTPLIPKRQLSGECTTQVTPACLQKLYGIPSTPASQNSSQLGVPGYIEQFAQVGSDLALFLQALRPDIDPNTLFGLETLDGGVNTQDPGLAGVEANLDIQYTVGLATGVPTVFISVGEDNQDGLGGFLDIATFLIGQEAPPTVLTTSYGFDEDALEPDAAVMLCDAYMQLSARGVSLLFASGDGGVAGSQPQECTQFLTTFPATCPYLTAVGATTGGVSPETAANFSTGGFSNVFPRPAYQNDAVSAYLDAIGTQNDGLFNASGRAIPDVSAQGQNLVIVAAGEGMLVDGTSASSPIFATGSGGRSPLGFLNPFLYGNPGMFFDVLSGHNPGCGTAGFPAVQGWDAVTGLGTPNFAAMLTAAGL
ncbi:subtilisin-like protein [Mucidula mucida]|nr:subtilisin-like protein [Mucidula mucida]